MARARSLEALPAACAVLALAVPVGWMLYLAARPLDTNDLWFHLKMGEVYLREGPWPGADPMLHTAHEDAPVQHEWLFGVAVHVVERVAGFHGLRALHLLWVAAILALAGALFARESRSVAGTCLALAVFVSLSWWRLFQLRPDLVSIPATLLVYRLAIAPPEGPSRGQTAATVGLFLVWANLHSLFAIGLVLLAVAWAGLRVRAWLGPGIASRTRKAADRRAARRVLALLALAGIATLVNPRGIHQHLTFFTSSRESAIWSIRDEWLAFDPFWRHYGFEVSPLAWVVTDLLLVAVLVAVAARLTTLVRRPSRRALHPADPVLLGLALAGVAALLISIRFLWMCVFPLLFLLRAEREAIEAFPRARVAAGSGLAVLAVAVSLAFPGPGRARLAAERIPAWGPDYLSHAVSTRVFPLAGVRFLADAGLTGNLFNPYALGGFLGYWLAPELRTFVDGRTEHYPAEILREYYAISDARGARPGESFLDVLDRRRVDVFFGVGVPNATQIRMQQYTVAHLEGSDSWIPVFRAIDHAIYLRRGDRNRRNLDRVAAYYADRGLPFDRERGFDADSALRSRPDWAVANGLLPVGHAALEAASASGDPERRREALRGLAVLHMLLGDHATELALDAQLLELEPGGKAPRRRRVLGLLRLGRADDALDEVRELEEVDALDAASRRLVRTVLDYRAWRRQLGRTRDAAVLAAARAGLHRVQLVRRGDRRRALQGGLAEVPLPERGGRAPVGGPETANGRGAVAPGPTGDPLAVSRKASEIQ